MSNIADDEGGFVVKQDGIYRMVPYYHPGLGWRDRETLELVISREAFLAALAMWSGRDEDDNK